MTMPVPRGNGFPQQMMGWFPPGLEQPRIPRSVLQSGLVYAFGGDNRMSGLTEFVFAATLRARDPQLRIRWMPNQSERFIEDDLLLERWLRGTCDGSVSAFRMVSDGYWLIKGG